MRKHRIERNLAFPSEEFRARVRTAAKQRLQYVLTCVAEPPEELLPAARARAKLRYAKMLRFAGQEVATRNKATLEGVLAHGKQQ